MTLLESSLIRDMYYHYNGRCFVCDKAATQRAHIIGNTALNKNIYGKEVVGNPLNWLPACSLECNKLIDIGKIPVRALTIKSIIISDIDDADKRTGIESVVRENIAMKKSKVKGVVK